MDGEVAKNIANLQNIIIDMNGDMTKKLKDVEKDKEFYIDMVAAQEAELANKVLLKVTTSMQDVTDQLTKLGPQLTDFLPSTTPAAP